MRGLRRLTAGAWPSYTPRVDEPRTHYQISLTARQAVGIFAGLLLAIGVAFFLGLMAGMSGRGSTLAQGDAPENAAGLPAEKTPAAADGIPLVETGVPMPTSSSASRTELAPAIVTPIPAEPTIPATLQTFEDGTGEDTAASALSGNSARVVPTRAPAPAPAARPAAAAPKVRGPAPASGRIWVQAASLQSREEANALTSRLSKHGFHVVILAASGPKGKVYRVRVGPYRTDDEAARAVTRLTKQEKIREPWVVPEGK
jgi:cell division septation protein DedD